MSREDESPLAADEQEEERLPEGVDLDDHDPIRALLRTAAKASDDEASSPNILPSVQKKLRERSRGKFYGDGWSTAQTTTSYVLVALMMLTVLGAAFYALGPALAR